MIQSNRIVQSGDALNGAESSEAKTDAILVEMSRLYVERCKEMRAGNDIIVQLLNHQITDLRDQLSVLE